VRRVSAEFTNPWPGSNVFKRFRIWIYYLIGKNSWQFRENWFHITGTWLWGLDLFILTRQPGPGELKPIDSSGEWRSVCDGAFPRTD
jgi:hypothetical protein